MLPLHARQSGVTARQIGGHFKASHQIPRLQQQLERRSMLAAGFFAEAEVPQREGLHAAVLARLRHLESDLSVLHRLRQLSCR